jgi:phosphoribosyl 1,2-cyclic phosphodiesterase
MTSNLTIRSSAQDGSTRVYCATCGHSEDAHVNRGNQRCLRSGCDCNRFIPGAGPDLSAQVLPP